MTCEASDPTALRVKALSFSDTFTIFCVLLAAIAISTAAASFFFHTPKETVTNAVIGILQTCFMLAFLCYAPKSRGIDIAGELKQKVVRRDIVLAVCYPVLFATGIVILATLIFTAAYFCSDSVKLLLQPDIAMTPHIPVITRDFNPLMQSPARRILSAIDALALAPVSEELIFRRFLYTTLRTKLPARWSIIISALIFAAWHPSFISPFCGGLLLAYVYERHQNLKINIAMHSFYNFSISLLDIFFAQ